MTDAYYQAAETARRHLPFLRRSLAASISSMDAIHAVRTDKDYLSRRCHCRRGRRLQSGNRTDGRHRDPRIFRKP
ncbi:MAG: hypothetical protein MZU97_04990 [Bacillus subtilis]|nr:hypothetical protein [Bacillus subtilis]